MSDTSETSTLSLIDLYNCLSSPKLLDIYTLEELQSLQIDTPISHRINNYLMKWNGLWFFTESKSLDTLKSLTFIEYNSINKENDLSKYHISVKNNYLSQLNEQVVIYELYAILKTELREDKFYYGFKG